MKSAKLLAALDLRAGVLRCAVATLLATILVLQSAMAAPGLVVPKSAPVEQSAKEAALRQKVRKVQPQSMVVVKLKNKEQLRGRLTEATDENFTVKVLQGESFVDRKLAYSEVKSFRPEKSGGWTAKNWLIFGVVVGVIIGVLAILGMKYSNS